MEKVLKLVDGIEKRMDRMDPLAVSGRRRRISLQSLESIIQEVILAFGDEFSRRGVAIEL